MNDYLVTVYSSAIEKNYFEDFLSLPDFAHHPFVFTDIGELKPVENSVFLISEENLIDIVKNPGEKYANQRIFILRFKDYIFLVPFVENEDEIFLKTIIPSRKATKKYLGGKT